MTAATAFRGQPLLVLVALLGGWFALRVALWQPSSDDTLFATPRLAEALGLDPGDRLAAAHDPLLGQAAFAFDAPQSLESRARLAYRPNGAIWRDRQSASALPGGPAASVDSASDSALRLGLVRAAVGHSLLFAAGLSQLDLPRKLTGYLQGAPQPGVPAAAPLLAGLPQPAPVPGSSRWSGDAWAMVRQDTTASAASGRPSYGRSQAGAVVRYRLAPSSPHAPQAYLRASSALAGPSDRDLAAGLSARPFPRLPLRLAVETRVSRTDRGTELRPAAIAVSELAPVSLPGRARAEAYVQAGYVGGRFATAFVDAQGRIERTVARIGGSELSAGAGVWGGAQEGAARLDAGPTAAVAFRLGETRGRLAADYRFRVAGDADPKSGPALTLSAGF